MAGAGRGWQNKWRSSGNAPASSPGLPRPCPGHWPGRGHPPLNGVIKEIFWGSILQPPLSSAHFVHIWGWASYCRFVPWAWASINSLRPDTMTILSLALNLQTLALFNEISSTQGEISNILGVSTVSCADRSQIGKFALRGRFLCRAL